jgi:hypothetical protein
MENDDWDDIDIAKPDELNYYWLPGTKVIGAMSFGKSGATPPIYGAGSPEHGMGTSSVSVGNVYGACPECLLVRARAARGGAHHRVRRSAPARLS